MILSAGLAIAAGTYIGGWRVIRTLGKGLTEITPPQGFSAETSASAVILASSHFGLPLSTTHVASGGIIGSGVGKRLAEVRWGIAGRMVVAWLVTLPAAAVVGAAATWSASRIGGAVGVLAIAGVLAVFIAVVFLASRRTAVNHGNVNDPVADARRPLSVQHGKA